MRLISPARSMSRLLLGMAILFVAPSANAQTTQFTYQGKLADTGSPANGSYDFQFKLFDAVSGGVQQGGTASVNSVQVTSGIFSVQLDFGAGSFPGANRFLEIAVKPTSGSTFTTLTPRQPVTANPYAIRSLNSTAADGLSVACVNCVTSSQIQSVQGSQVAGNIAGGQINGLIPVASVPAGNTNYIQNGTSPQVASNFNISGNGSAGGTLSGNTVNAAIQFNLGGSRVLSNAGSFNLFGGPGAGQNNTTGFSNSFFGANAGLNNTTAAGNSFFGANAGANNTTANNNSFFGAGAGGQNTAGQSNSFFGANAGSHNMMGNSNSFFGSDAGVNNTTGTLNAFFGSSSGVANTTGSFNAFFGYWSGTSNTTGFNNAFFGQGAGKSNTTGQDNTFLGNYAGFNNTTASGTTFIGSGAGLSNTTGLNNSFLGFNAGIANTVGHDNTFIGYQTGLSNVGSTDPNNPDSGHFNTFVGSVAGRANTEGGANTFVGDEAGRNNTTGLVNSFVGAAAGRANTVGQANAFFGAFAGASNTAGIANTFSGDNAGYFNTTGSFDSFFGQAAGDANTTGSDNSFFGSPAGFNNTTGMGNVFIGSNSGSSNTTEDNNTFIGFQANGSAGVTNSTAIGANAVVTTSNTMVLGKNDGSVVVDVPGKLQIDTLATAGSTQLCLNSSNRVGACSSSLRYKTNLQPFSAGLSIINRLRPVTFTWKDGGMRDLGFAAEDVENIDPLLVTYNKQGRVEGVKYDRINVALVNAINELQKQIEELNSIKSENARLKAQLAEVFKRLEQIAKATAARR